MNNKKPEKKSTKVDQLRALREEKYAADQKAAFARVKAAKEKIDPKQ